MARLVRITVTALAVIAIPALVSLVENPLQMGAQYSDLIANGKGRAAAIAASSCTTAATPSSAPVTNEPV